MPHYNVAIFQIDSSVVYLLVCTIIQFLYITQSETNYCNQICILHSICVQI